MKDKSTELHQLPQGHNLVLVVNALGEVRIAIISVVESLLSLVSLSMLDPKYIKKACRDQSYGVTGGFRLQIRD